MNSVPIPRAGGNHAASDPPNPTLRARPSPRANTTRKRKSVSSRIELPDPRVILKATLKGRRFLKNIGPVHLEAMFLISAVNALRDRTRNVMSAAEQAGIEIDEDVRATVNRAAQGLDECYCRLFELLLQYKETGPSRKEDAL